MKFKLYLSMGVADIIDRMGKFMQKEGFLFAENDKTYEVHFEDKEMRKIQNWSKFWLRKQLGGDYPPHFALVIQGEVKLERNASVIEGEIIEYHGNREHNYGGSRAIDTHFNSFCEIFKSS